METEETERFQCFVCLELIYKPVVLECGHVSCFWCVHRAMSAVRDSSCAICRQPYKFFPGICHLLHHLLVKLEPEAYKQREAETLEEEKIADCFSPQCIENSVNGEPEINSNLIHTEALREKGVSSSDVLCSGCRDLLFRPAVLNCGHAFCEPCMSRLSGEKIKCPTCGDMHPGGLPKVCLDLEHFLEKEFPLEYARRRDSFKPEWNNMQSGSSSSSASQTDTLHKQTMIQKKMTFQIASGGFLEDEELSNVHVGVGCDACGMYPIMGKRYKCRDCKESIGFDLCEACYDTPSKRPGRFNQQHTPDHRLTLEESSLLFNMLKEYLRDGLLSDNGDEWRTADTMHSSRSRNG